MSVIRALKNHKKAWCYKSPDSTFSAYFIFSLLKSQSMYGNIKVCRRWLFFYLDLLFSLFLRTTWEQTPFPLLFPLQTQKICHVPSYSLQRKTNNWVVVSKVSPNCKNSRFGRHLPGPCSGTTACNYVYVMMIELHIKSNWVFCLIVGKLSGFHVPWCF